MKRTINDITKERSKRRKNRGSPGKRKKKDDDGVDPFHENSVGTFGSQLSDPSSPGKIVKAQDLEALNKATETAAMFNFESIRK